MTAYYHREIDSPAGGLGIVADGEGRLVKIAFLGRGEDLGRGLDLEAGGELIEDEARTERAAVQLGEYFNRRRRSFDLELAPRGTDFQLRVWRAVADVPYGETASYAEIAERVGRPGAARAVGRANGTNPIPIVVPCHRVIGADGSLTGYGGGLEVKRALLELEGWRGAGAEQLTLAAV